MWRFPVNARGLALTLVLTAAGCSAAPTTHPYDTQPIPEGAKFQQKCTFLGEVSCNLISFISGDAGYERRPACIAFVEPNGTKVEQCGSVPGSTPQP